MVAATAGAGVTAGGFAAQASSPQATKKIDTDLTITPFLISMWNRTGRQLARLVLHPTRIRELLHHLLLFLRQVLGNGDLHFQDEIAVL